LKSVFYLAITASGLAGCLPGTPLNKAVLRLVFTGNMCQVVNLTHVSQLDTCFIAFNDHKLACYRQKLLFE